jgi:hypothetical protein
MIIASATATARLIEMNSHCFTICESYAILMSHHHPLPARKRQHENRCRGVSSLYPRVPPRIGFHFRVLLSLLVTFLSCSSLAAPVSAAEAHGDRPALLVQDDLAWAGSPLHLDLSPPPIAPLLLMPPIQSADDVTNPLSAPPSKRSINTDPNGGATDFTVPKAFDTGLSNNFTSSCSNFLNRLRVNDDFNNCNPFSLLLQVSILLLLAKNKNKNTRTDYQ